MKKLHNLFPWMKEPHDHSGRISLTSLYVQTANNQPPSTQLTTTAATTDDNNGNKNDYPP